jgi:hypothetical protein
MLSLAGIGWSVVAFIFLTYLIPHFVVTFLKPKDLKKAYNAKWGLVTGASSGTIFLKQSMYHHIKSCSSLWLLTVKHNLFRNW